MSVAQCRNAVTWEEKFFACPVLALCQSRGWSVALHGALQQKAMRHDPVQGKHVPDHVFDGALHASQHPPPLCECNLAGPDQPCRPVWQQADWAAQKPFIGGRNVNLFFFLRPVSFDVVKEMGG